MAGPAGRRSRTVDIAAALLAELATAGHPMDDDQLARQLGVARQAVNAMCRRLATDGRIKRWMPPTGKILNRSISTSDLRPVILTAIRSIRRASRTSALGRCFARLFEPRRCASSRPCNGDTYILAGATMLPFVVVAAVLIELRRPQPHRDSAGGEVRGLKGASTFLAGPPFRPLGMVIAG